MRRDRVVLTALVAADVLVLWQYVALRQVQLTAAVLVAIAFASFLPVTLKLPRGDLLSGCVGVCVAGIMTVGGPTTAAATAIGSLFALPLRRKGWLGEGVGLDLMRQPLLVVAASSLWRWMPSHATPYHAQGLVLVGYMLFVAGFVTADLLSYAMLSSFIRKERFLPSALAFMRLVGGIYLGLGSVGVVLALVFRPTRIVDSALSSAILVALMVIMKHNFGLFLQVRSAYSRAVGVLAHLAESESEEARGHSERVADLATEIGRRLRVPRRDLERLSLASLLHAIGRVRGESSCTSGSDCGCVGARIASSIEILQPVAPLVERFACAAGEAELSHDLLLAHVVGVACRFDELTATNGGRETELKVLDDMMADSDRYAPRVVTALREARGL